MAACGGTTNGGDGGPPDAAGDSTTTSDAANGTDASDASNNGDVSTGGDGGLQVGDTCDPNNNQCASGLLCCSEPTHIPDASTAYLCEKPVNGGCPKFP